MANIIGVKFRCASKMYYFDPLEEVFESGDRVVVETARGIEMGRVVVPNREVEEEDISAPLKPIIRKATEKDLENEKINKAKEPEAFRICKEKIQAHELEMKLVTVEYTFDGSKVLFYFTADGRVDFRELVKDLASTFRTRIELRQIGVRDEAKIKGGIGICGRPLCCSSYLCDFVPVSIKMAKEQNLSLNPTKISGCCGRLMCCLKNEEETYEELNSRLPSIGDAVTVRSDRTKGSVQSVNVLRQKVRVLINANDGDTEVKEYDVEELLFEKGRRTFPVEEEPEELRELEELEEKEEAELREEDGAGKPDRNRRNRGDRRDRRDNREPRNDRERRPRNNRAEDTDFRENKAAAEGDTQRNGRVSADGKESAGRREDGADQPAERRNRREGETEQPREHRDRRERPRRNDRRPRREDRQRDGEVPETPAAEDTRTQESQEGRVRREGNSRRNRQGNRREDAPQDAERQEGAEVSSEGADREENRSRRSYRNHNYRKRPRRGPETDTNE